MIYYFTEEQGLEKAHDSYEHFLYFDPLDLRNFAFSYVYENGEVEQVLRTLDLKQHILGIQKLYLKSKKLKHYVSSKQIQVVDHYPTDVFLAKKRVLSIYCFNSSTRDSSIQIGYLNAPCCLTDSQKQFLEERLKYFSLFDIFDVGQYNSEVKKMNDLTLNESDFVKVIRKLIQK